MTRIIEGHLAPHVKAATDCLTPDGAAECVVVSPQDNAGATPLFIVTLDVGWAQRIIAAGMYERIAVGVAHAIAAVLDCDVEQL